ncbi:MAG: site-specific integrase [Rhizobiaceae bacterium]
MSYILRHVDTTKDGNRYRRRIPLDVKEALGGRTSFTRSLGKTHSDVVLNYPRVHEELERLVEGVRSNQNPLQNGDIAQKTELELFKELERRIRAKGFDPQQGSFDPSNSADEIEFNSRDFEAERVMNEYPIDPTDGGPLDMNDADYAYVRALYGGVPQQPLPTLEDARRHYVEEKGLNDLAELKNLQRINSVVGHIRDALQRDPILPTLRRQEAREVMRYMLDDLRISPPTVARYLNDIRAVINHGLVEFDCTDANNPFKGLNPPSTGLAKDKRRPLRTDELSQITTRIDATANDELRIIWSLLMGTGCRLNEIVGLRVSDVVLDQDVPHIKVQMHPDRRLKTDASNRWVPLVGDAVTSAKQAVECAADNSMLFPRYGGKISGSASASKALMKHVRAITTDKKAVVHSLRHNMKDWLKEAGASKQVQDEILGHTSGGVSENYGGFEADLRVAAKWMLTALAVKGG